MKNSLESRRHFLRGAGVALALPWLESLPLLAQEAQAADPNKPIPYYLKGKALINKASVDPKTNKIVAPPGCAESYEKYLELAPDGPFAADAKSVLAEMGTTVKGTYKAGKKS